MAIMHNPLHPGEIVKDALMATNLNITELAKRLKVDRTTLSRLLNGNSNISPDMALRLALLLGTSVQMWLNIQRDWELSKLEKKKSTLRIEPLEKAA